MGDADEGVRLIHGGGALPRGVRARSDDLRSTAGAGVAVAQIAILLALGTASIYVARKYEPDKGVQCLHNFHGWLLTYGWSACILVGLYVATMAATCLVDNRDRPTATAALVAFFCLMALTLIGGVFIVVWTAYGTAIFWQRPPMELRDIYPSTECEKLHSFGYLPTGGLVLGVLTFCYQLLQPIVAARFLPQGTTSDSNASEQCQQQLTRLAAESGDFHFGGPPTVGFDGEPPRPKPRLEPMQPMQPLRAPRQAV